jgi:peptidylprolyl isomerase
MGEVTHKRSLGCDGESAILEHERFVAKGDHVLVHLTAFYNGKAVFTTSEAEAKRHGIYDPNEEYKPWWSIAGAGRFPRGVEEALIGMREGEVRVVEVPPEKGFPHPHELVGKRLVFKIELLSHIKPYHIAELHC